jgi:hypothetical protein
VRLAVVLVAGIVSIVFAIARLERRRDPIVSYATRARVRLRTTARPDAANTAQASALREAWKALPGDKGDFEARRSQQPIWLAMNRSGLVIQETKQLPRGAFLAMRRATQ